MLRDGLWEGLPPWLLWLILVLVLRLVLRVVVVLLGRFDSWSGVGCFGVFGVARGRIWMRLLRAGAGVGLRRMRLRLWLWAWLGSRLAHYGGG